jgi:hypothetical protein
MMDMHARFGNVSAAKAVLCKLAHPSVSLYGFMIKAYGESDQINDATEVFHFMLNDKRVTPNIQSFNIFLNAIAQSKSLGYATYDYGTEIMNVLNTDERYVALQIEPDEITYNILLKCLTRSAPSYQDAGLHAETILIEMDNRSKSNPKLRPSRITYHLAIKVCLIVDDQQRMDSLMKRMQDSDIHPDTRLCNSILNQYAQTGTIESAQRAESFLYDLKEMGKTNVSIRPNEWTYNIVLNAWGRSNDPNFAQRMWNIYTMMITDGAPFDEVTYHTLLGFLSKTPDSIGLADKVLQESERYINNDSVNRFQPGASCYSIAIKGYLKFNDAENATRLLYRWFDVSNRSINDRTRIKQESMVQLYYPLVQTWLSIGDIERSTIIVEKIQELYDQKRILESPNRETYTLLYDSWNQSHHPSKDVYLEKIKLKVDSYQ